MNFRFFIFAMLLMSAPLLNAQDFLDGAYGFSHSKDAHFTLKTGENITAFVENVKRKKGLISSIEIKDAAGKKTVLSPDKVKHMYLPPTDFDKLGRAMNVSNNVTKWDRDQSAHAEYIKGGYVYFEHTDVMVKKKKMSMMMQVINPGFADGIKVYFNPLAQETGGLSVGGLQVTGGDDRSYYFKKGDKTAYLIDKKNYSKEVKNLYGDCPDVAKAFGNKFKWSEAAKHVAFYSENCSK
ncbi:MAG: hypothetical protein IAE84_13085 [Saprospiraceae bacterium]|jgi:hypothetical protein|nr:hypothetical protein [Saprospiraceae bacterium]HRD80746.1 hypothetical protein [Saprospiraceae bacterium]